MKSSISVAILEDLAEVAEGLKALINGQNGMECLHTYGNAEDAITFLPHHPTDVLIVDIGLPRLSGIEAISLLSATCPQTQFCIFTVYEEDEKIFQSLKAGAKGYILKSAPAPKIIEAIQDLYHGGSPMSPSIARRVLDSFNKPNPLPLPVTPRELELLQLLAKGLLYKEIASDLNITTGTVKQHIHKIYDKLQVSNRTEAVNKLEKR
ncbi:MAG TPA: response regulator transcription factor [Saprospiraceae bacterium]|nr:response regulator transcription factor [Saprospiraceae bacterium]